MMPFDESGLAAILPSRFVDLVAQVRRVRALAAACPELQAEAQSRERASAGLVDQVAVIPIHGVISKRESIWTALTGGTSLDALQAQLAVAGADPNVRAVVLHVDSPGGGVYGVDETAAQIADLNKRKPVIAFADGLAASAGFWLIAGADRIVATPSAEVGSIGVFAVHFDESGLLAKEGIVPTLVKAGEHKAEANPFQPLSEDDRDAMQARIDAHYARFVARVAKGRGVSASTVRDKYGSGRVVDAQQAHAAGMVTDIGGWLDVVRIATTEARKRTSPGQTQAQPAQRVNAGADDLLRLRLQIDELSV